MALCSRCGGGFDYHPLLKRRPLPPVAADPFCPTCGEQRNVLCTHCGGEGYTAVAVTTFSHEYCTHCGEALRQYAYARCPECNGAGRKQHVCAARALPEQPPATAHATLFFSRQTAVVRRPQTALVRGKQ